ncbi:MAG: hypothetical protein IJ711_00855 [Lachnospiraceae bacterium]|nr:hypothetical protein [Lachnospiraceae bacterium]
MSDEMLEKEYNGMLFDQLAMLDRLARIATDEDMKEAIALERSDVEKKLYQNPPLTQ